MHQRVRRQATAKVREIGVVERFVAEPREGVGIAKHHRHTVVKLPHEIIGLGRDHREGVALPQPGEKEARALSHGEKDFTLRTWRAEAGLEITGGG